MTISRSLILGTTLALLVLGGCNVFEGFYEEGTSSDPDVLTQDAATALAKGRTQDAINYAEKALQQDSLHVSAINVLATAELQQADVDVVTLTELVDVLTLQTQEALGKQAPPSLLAANASSTCPATETIECDFCSLGELTDHERVHYSTLGAYQRLLQAHRALLRIEQFAGPVYATLRGLVQNAPNMSELFSQENSRKAVWERLVGLGTDRGSDNPEKLTADLLMTLAIARVANSVRAVTVMAQDKQITIYKVYPHTSSETFSYCAASLEDVEDYVEETVCDKVKELQTALDMLRARQENYSQAARNEDDPVQILIDEADDALEDYRNSESYGRCGGL